MDSHHRYPFSHPPPRDFLLNSSEPTHLDFGNESGSDESDGEDDAYFANPTITNQKRGGGDGPVMLDVDTWLAELDTLTLIKDLDSSRPVDPFRFSQATLEDTQEDELNAILGELTALQQSLDREIKPIGDKNGGGRGQSGHSGGSAQNAASMNSISEQNHTKAMSTTSENGGRTESPDNDSGFSDNASLLSSGSSLSASGSSSGSSTTSSRVKPPSLLPSSVIHPNELAALLSARLECRDSIYSSPGDEKAEKIRVALAKIRAASVTRLYVKAFSPDGSSKALMVEESMSCGRVLALLADKNHVPLSSKWALVEHIPHLHMERIYEDHENMVENLLMWTRDSKNKIYFVERDDKYDMFLNPQPYFGGLSSTTQSSLDEHGRRSLVEEFYAHGYGVPEVESSLYLKAEGKKAWKKFPFVLRASGVYYFPKGKTHANSSKDLVCLGTIDHNTQAYEGVGWRKKFKAPTEFGFVLKPARLQAKSHRHMKYLCAEDVETLRLWMVGLRIAKHGRVLWENYQSLQEDIAHEDLDRFGRSVSLASMPIQITTTTTNYNHQSTPEEVKGGGRKYSSNNEFMTTTSSPVLPPPANHVPLNGNSNGDRMVLAVNPSHPPSTLQTIVAMREEGFESDAPVGGTIKRKPSTVLSPKIPLTLNTRSLVSEYITPGQLGEGNTVTLAHTLQRKRSGSGTPSTCSSSSSSSIILSSPVHNNHHHPIGKPPPHGGGAGGSLSLAKPLEVPASVGEETLDSLEIANLPPPPPELLEYGGCDEVNVVGSVPAENPYQIPPAVTSMVAPPPMSILKLNPGGTLPNPLLRHPSIESTSSTQSLPKKGVTFANELSQRLMTRNHLSPPGNMESVTTNPVKNCTKLNLPLHLPPPLSSPKKMEDPPQDFLTDLQRVMQKKWQVAQKCHVSNTSPQEILGFRFEPTGQVGSGPPQPYPLESPLSEECQSENGDPVNPATLNNVRAWVSQHYGGPHEPASSPSSPPPPPPSSGVLIPGSPARKPVPPVPNAKPQQRVSFGVPLPPAAPPSYPQPPIYQAPSPATNVVIYENFQGRKHSAGSHGSGSQLMSNYNNHGVTQYQVQLRNKKPPPPIPKRADSTHLSAHFVYN